MQLTGGITFGGLSLSAASPSPVIDEIVGMAASTSPYNNIYNFRSDTGFGTKFSNPSTPIGSAGTGIRFTPTKDAVIFAVDASPYIEAYQFNTTTGFGTKYSNPSSGAGLTGGGVCVAINPTGTQVMVGGGGSGFPPHIAAYDWTYASGFGSKYSNPVVALAGTAYGIDFNIAGDSVLIGQYSSPYIAAYQWSGSGFGTRYSNPGTLPSSVARDGKFSPDGATAAVSTNSSPWITAYPWTYASGFGTKYADPSPAITTATDVGKLAFSPSSDAIAITLNVSPRIEVYKWTSGSGFGTKYSNPDPLPTGIGYSVSYNTTGSAIIVGHATAPYVSAYPWTYASGFGSKYANPSVAVTPNVSDMQVIAK
jgi:hypothetical protein